MRSRNVALLVWIALSVVASLAMAGPEKVSPLLRKYTHPGLEIAFDHPRSQLPVGLLSTAGAADVIPCLIQGQVTREALEALGVTVRTRAGSVYTALIPADRLAAVSDLPGVVRIEPARRMKTTLDVATVETNVQSEVHGGTGAPWSGNIGTGVLVGNVDSGIDYTHEDFKDALGNTRFDRIWDQQIAGTPPAGFGYGTEWTTAQIQAGTPTVTNPDGHGTHVLGILGGDGSSTGTGSAPAFTFTGVAPGATLAHVRTDFSDAGIVDGANWIFQRAAALGLPAVVNISLGGQYGPHDGTDVFEVALDALTGPGRIITTSASNDRGVGIHSRGTVPTNGNPSSVSFQFVVDTYTRQIGTQNDLVLFSGWYEGGDNFTVTVTGPTGGTLTVTKGNVTSVNSADGAIQIENGTTTPTNGDTEVFVALYDAVQNNSPRAGTWTMTFSRVTSTAANIDVWMYYSSMGARFTTGTTDDVTIGNPACASQLITVAAYTTKRQWPSRDGNTYQWNPLPTLNELADFSGRGPTRTGGQKPDLAAPGFGVVSALSDDVALNASTIPLILPGDVHWIQAGTSMSAPMVGGLAALILAKEGALTPAEVKQRMNLFARTDVFVGAVWNEDWGWGKMNAEPADILGPTVTVSAPNGGESYPAGGPVTILWTASDNFGVTGVDLHYSTDGGASYPNLIAAGVPNTGSYAWTAPSLNSGTMRVRVTATDTVENTGVDASNANFTVTLNDPNPPVVTVLAPNGGEVFITGAVTQLTWSASDAGSKPGLGPLATVAGVDSVAVWYSLDNGANWTLEASGEENDGVYTWRLPATASDSALVRVTAWDPNLNQGQDESDAVFTLGAPLGAGDAGFPAVLTLGQSRPNPIRGASASEIVFGLPEPGRVRLRVYDAGGRLVATLTDQTFPAGFHRARWNGIDAAGSEVPSGMYFYRLEAPSGVQNRKLLVVR